jgi:hypothetical protein
MKFLIKDSMVFFIAVSVTRGGEEGVREEGQNAVVRSRRNSTCSEELISPLQLARIFIPEGVFRRVQ